VHLFLFLFFYIYFNIRTEALDEYYQLLDAGANTVCVQERESSLNMFSSLVSSLGLSVTPQGYNPQQTDTAPLAGLVQYLRLGSDIAVKETILKRRQEKSVEYLSTDRESVSDTTYFDRFRQSLLRPFSTPPKSPQLESLLFEVNRQFQGFLGSSKLSPDDPDLSIAPATSIKDSAVETSIVESGSVSSSSGSDQILEVKMGSRGQVQLIQRESEAGVLMTPEQLLLVLEDSTSADLKGALVCPLPPRPTSTPSSDEKESSVDFEAAEVIETKKKK